MTIETVGVVGLGNMGLPMAATLARKGFDVWGFDLSEERRRLAQAQGIHAVPELAGLLRRVDAVVASLPLGRDVEAMVRTPAGLLDRADRRVIVLDTSTADATTSRRLAALLASRGHGHLDAPVSGGPAGAAGGQLTMMIGGDDEDLSLARPVVEALAARAVHVGPSGAGNVAKLINNMLVAAHLITNGEAFRLAEAAGVKAEAVLEVVNAATGRSAVSEAFYPKWVLSGRFDSGFAAGLMRKDVGLAAEMAAELGLALPLSRHVAEIWSGSREELPDGADFTRMTRYQAPDRE
ncbi:NAD(P)-dependent oxidoreductase [Roseomonas sp. M0104]|uniref:NAD(P)-dependent oxidoreductase n=1 Tax=Teichococcus coralli TaxID=2545983 RepID=A0A845BJH9_9PROT|nr:NAD(P)-dependent oxidoreductase [Pseudoroseomonas coralli]MXP65332.1 NAD(P)-dependent oxidoreductase [Pseudoroseomonas coralli]